MPKPTIAELQIKVNNLEHKLREANPEPNMTQKIEARELECTDTIKYLIKSCEEETGRCYSPLLMDIWT